MQRSASKLKVDAAAVEQLSLLAAPGKKPSRPVSFDRIYTLVDTADALSYACELAGVSPKAIYGDMEIDKTVWSRILSGEWDLDGRDVPKLNKVTGNNAYLMYLNHLDGIDLHSIRKTMDDKERENFELRQKLAQRDEQLRVAVELISGRVPR